MTGLAFMKTRYVAYPPPFYCKLKRYFCPLLVDIIIAYAALIDKYLIIADFSFT